jgi:excisionase family DNA binding protein
MFIKKTDVMKMFGVSLPTVDRLMKKGMPYYKIGGKIVRFDKEELEKWFKERAQND